MVEMGGVTRTLDTSARGQAGQRKTPSFFCAARPFVVVNARLGCQLGLSGRAAAFFAARLFAADICLALRCAVSVHASLQ